MSTEANKELIGRFIQAVDDNDSSDWSALDDYIAEDFVAHNPPYPGVPLHGQGMKLAAEIFRQATPGTHEIPQQVAEAISSSATSSVADVTKGSCSESRRRTRRSTRPALRSTESGTERSSSTGRSWMSRTS